MLQCEYGATVIEAPRLVHLAHHIRGNLFSPCEDGYHSRVEAASTPSSRSITRYSYAPEGARKYCSSVMAAIVEVNDKSST